jgi:hypothetical protein
LPLKADLQTTVKLESCKKVSNAAFIPHMCSPAKEPYVSSLSFAALLLWWNNGPSAL